MNDDKLEAMIVLGNGFDLSLGIKSSYNDFYLYLKDTYPFLIQFEHKYSRQKFNILHIQNCSIWTLLFICNKSNTENWFDIEHNIYQFFTSLGQSYDKLNFVTFSYFIQNELFYTSKEIRANNPEHYNKKKIIEHFAKKHSLTDNDTEKDILNALLIELNILESEFKKYMLTLLNDYDKNSEILFKSIISHNTHKTSDIFSDLVILNFNYTSIITNKINNFSKSDDFMASVLERNIHGKLDDENHDIIFGIDSKEVNSKSPAYQFTKTYRVMRQSISNTVLDIIRIRNDYDYIYFYGHSLGEQDYSYFQSIFDIINLYSGKTVLRFLYSPYHKEPNENIIYEQNFTANVAKLIESYGESFETEKIKGKNLLHRLILENRLEIIEFKI